MVGKTTKPMQRVFEIRIELWGLEPPIWRRIVVPEDMSLVELHAAIQGAMGWQDCHLHLFEIEGQRYEIPENDELGPEDGYLDERHHRLKDVFKEESECLYVYDFGDNWRHLIRVEGHRLAGQHDRPPQCVAGERACPPEDCGGPYQYPEFLAAFDDSMHPQHESTREWAGPFDPNVFSVSQANALIGAIVALYRERDPSKS